MAPLFVGSNSDDSRIRSDRVGLAASTSNPASAVTGDVYYNSTDNKLTVYNGSDWASAGGGGTAEFIASGTIPNGATVIINTDGTVGVITQTALSTPTFGSAVVYNSGNTPYSAAVFDPINKKVVIAYPDYGNSNYVTAIVGTVSGNTISFGSEVVAASTSSSYVSAAYDSTNDKVVIAYRDDGNSGHGTAIVGTVSGTSISFGSATVFESASTEWTSTAYDSSNQKIVIAYQDKGNSNYGTAVVGTVSGTSISFGSPVVFESASEEYNSIVYDSANQKVVIAYMDSGNGSRGTAIVGTVSGTSISFGSPVVFNSSNNTYYISAVYDSTNQKVVIAYTDLGNSQYGTAIVGTVSGTSISFGSEVVFESATTQFISITYDSNINRVIIAYQDNSNSSYGTAVIGTVSDTSISFGTPVVFESATTAYTAMTFDSSNNKAVIAYRDGGNSSAGTAIVATTSSTNLTTENFIGFSDAAYTNGQTAKIQIEGSVDDAQSGLTTARKHYVQGDGTLSTTAGDPSVPAGTAISGTKIIIET